MKKYLYQKGKTSYLANLYIKKLKLSPSKEQLQHETKQQTMEQVMKKVKKSSNFHKSLKNSNIRLLITI